MNSPLPSPVTQDLASEIRSLAAGVRIVPFVLVMILSYLGLHAVSNINAFEAVWRDILGGKPLPGLTALLLKGKIFLILLAGAIPIAAVFIQFRVQNHRVALISLSVLIVLSFLLTHTVWSGLTLPFRQIYSGMRGDM